MIRTISRLAAALALAGGIGATAVPAGAFDMLGANMAFDQQFDQWAAGSMNTMLQQCAMARAAGLLQGGCFDGYDPSILSDSNTGGDAIAGGYWQRQQMMDNAANNFSNGFNNQQVMTDQFGNTFWGAQNPGGSNWVDNSGQVFQTDPGFGAPNNFDDFDELFPVE